MNEKAKGWIAFIVVAAVIVMGYLALSTPEEFEVGGETVTVTIGFMGALSGDIAFIGENVRAAVEVAVEELNYNGGINGTMVEVVYEDSGCDATMGASAANKLVNIDNVTAIIGPTCTPAALAAAPIAEEAGVPMISYSATAATISEAGDYIFRTAPSDAFQASFAAEYASGVLGAETVAILHCLNDWCQGNADTFEEMFTGDVVATESFEQDATDLRTQITKAQAEEPDLVYFLAFTSSTVAGVQEMEELGLLEDTIVFGADTWTDATVWEELGETANGLYYTQPTSIEFADDFVAAMEEKLGEEEEVTVYAPRGYDAVMILAEAIAEAGLDREAIKNALYEVDGHEGLADTYSFDENGDPSTAAYDVLEIVDGEPVVLE